MKFRKKPVVIEAMQWTGANAPELLAWMRNENTGKPCATDARWVGGRIEIQTLEGTMEATHGDWIIRGVKGELYPCKPDIFEATYEEVIA